MPQFYSPKGSAKKLEKKSRDSAGPAIQRATRSRHNMSTKSSFESIAVLGCGHIGTAVVEGLLNAENSPLKRIVVTTKSTGSLDKLKTKFGRTSKAGNIEIQYTNSNTEAAQASDVVILAVEPHLARDVLQGIADDIEGKLLLSIVAGLELDVLAEYAQNVGIIMTSTLITYTKVPIAYVLGEKAKAYEESFLEVFSPLGELIPIKPQDLGITGSVLGCATAFSLVYIDAIVKGGLSRGLTVDQGRKMILGVLKGTAAMLEQSGKAPDDIITSLCTPGGTTIDGLISLEEGNFRYVVSKAVQVSSDKAKQLHK